MALMVEAMNEVSKFILNYETQNTIGDSGCGAALIDLNQPKLDNNKSKVSPGLSSSSPRSNIEVNKDQDRRANFQKDKLAALRNSFYSLYQLHSKSK